MSTNPHERTRGRPHSVDVEHAVYAETLRLVAMGTAPALTRRAIADGAGVSRQTLYNRWLTVGDIVLDALMAQAERTIGVNPNDLGLRGYLTDLAESVNGWARPGLRYIVAAALLDTDFAARLRSRFLNERHGRLQAAVADERPLASEQVGAVAEVIAATMWYRIVIVDERLDEQWIDAMCALADTTTRQR
ncbi:MAG: TetR-like C-terminal domain-containing protein [Actinomycetota bacterium]